MTRKLNTTAVLDPDVEIIAKEFHKRSLLRDGLTDIHRTWNEQWEDAKTLYAENPDLYTRPAHAIEDAMFAVRFLRSAETHGVQNV